MNYLMQFVWREKAYGIAKVLLIIKDMNIDKNLMFDHTLFTQFRIPKLSVGDYHLHSPFFHGGKSLS